MQRVILVVACLVLMTGTSSAVEPMGGACLYGSLMDDGKVMEESPCGDRDPLNLAKDPDVGRVLRAFGIRPGVVRFRGCEKGLFKVQDTGPNGAEGNARYVLTYQPAGLYLAPTAHELAHVLQMEMAGGYQALKDTLPSKRIELGADYLAGIVLSQVLQHLDTNQFQGNLLVVGQYYEAMNVAHGSPVERTNAFRWGMFRNFGSLNRDYRRAADDFQANIYPRVVER